GGSAARHQRGDGRRAGPHRTGPHGPLGAGPRWGRPGDRAGRRTVRPGDDGRCRLGDPDRGRDAETPRRARLRCSMTPVTDATHRIRRQRRRSRLRSVVRALVAALLALLLGAGVWLIVFSPVLAVQRVEVTGPSVLDSGTVERTAAIGSG